MRITTPDETYSNDAFGREWESNPRVTCVECKKRIAKRDANPFNRHNQPNHSNDFWTRYYLCEDCLHEYTCAVCGDVVYDVSFDLQRHICEHCADEYTLCRGCNEWTLNGTILRGYCRSCGDGVLEDLFDAKRNG